jgi:SSS family solute:Na+ symporter
MAEENPTWGYTRIHGALKLPREIFHPFFNASLQGVFILAMLTKRATATGAFWGLLAGMAVVLLVAFTTRIAFLWHNLIGAVVVVVVGLGVGVAEPKV